MIDSAPHPIADSSIRREDMLRAPPRFASDFRLPTSETPVQIEMQADCRSPQLLDPAEHLASVAALNVVIVRPHPYQQVSASARVHDLDGSRSARAEERHIPGELLRALERVIVPSFDGISSPTRRSQQNDFH